VRPANGASITVREIPAAAASRDVPTRKALKSPPHVAAPAGAAKKRVQNRIAVDRNGVHLLDILRVVGIFARGRRKASHFSTASPRQLPCRGAGGRRGFVWPDRECGYSLALGRPDLAEPHPGPASVLIDELDTGDFQGLAHRKIICDR
jgi:hypothetical protein